MKKLVSSTGLVATLGANHGSVSFEFLMHGFDFRLLELSKFQLETTVDFNPKSQYL
jgi:UDP-N-acetylmuramoylalanine-D-glutamate ligase